MPGAGLEPARLFSQGILSPKRLPFRHPGATFAVTVSGRALSVNPLAAREMSLARRASRNHVAAL